MDYMDIWIARFHFELDCGMGNDQSNFVLRFCWYAVSSFLLVFWAAGLVAEDGHTWWGGRIDTVALVDAVDEFN